MRERWIKVGSLKSNARMSRGGQGWPFLGYWLNWRGRTDWCQPNEFADMAGVEWAVRRRLEFARLELVALASKPPQLEFQELFALVKRRIVTTTLKLNFLRETDLARYYEHPVSHIKQWVPRSVCPHTTKLGDVHEVKIQAWWLAKNPFEMKAGDQDELFR